MINIISTGPVTQVGAGGHAPTPPPTHTHTHTRTHTYTHFFAQQKQKMQTKAKKKGFQSRNYQKVVTKAKILLFQPFQSVQIFFGQSWWLTILFGVPWPPPILKSISPTLQQYCYFYIYYFFRIRTDLLLTPIFTVL